jgi:crotonobetainyl-CoA:carnitine CoA-transferase CaiB-like acyl-CoA transferase
VIEGFRPGVADRLGIGADELCALNPRLIYCSLSGMGQVGDLAEASGHDLNYQAWAGALAPEHGTPSIAAVPIADLAGGLAAAYAICAAIVRQQRTGEGERIDVAMGDVLATWTGANPPAARGVEPGARGVPGYGLFAATDGYVTLGIITEDHFWAPLCDVLGMEDVRDLTFLERMKHVLALQDRIGRFIASQPRDDVVRRLLAAGVPAASVLDRAEMVQLPHFRARDVVVDDFDGQPVTGHPVRFVQHPAARVTRAPDVDEHRGEGFR